jgi:DNA invertase Pin-like site-specific DNA recombinase
MRHLPAWQRSITTSSAWPACPPTPRTPSCSGDALGEAGCGRIFEEKISTRKTERPGLAVALDYLRPGDTLCVWKLDRLGRSARNILIIADSLHDRGIGLRILTGKLAGSYTPAGEGKFFFTMMAAFAELERDIIHERTMAGLAAARAQGRTGGRPTVMDAGKLAAAQARRASGESPTQIARALGVSRASIYRHLAATPGRPSKISNLAPGPHGSYKYKQQEPTKQNP